MSSHLPYAGGLALENGFELKKSLLPLSDPSMGWGKGQGQDQGQGPDQNTESVLRPEAGKVAVQVSRAWASGGKRSRREFDAD